MTTYRMALNPNDFRRCHEFLREADSPFTDYKFQSPTVFAERENEIVGVVGTNRRKKLIIAEPMWVRAGGNPTFLILGLVEAYEQLIARLGVPFYYFHILHEDKKWKSLIDRIGIPSIGEDDIGTWYRRDLIDDSALTGTSQDRPRNG